MTPLVREKIYDSIYCENLTEIGPFSHQKVPLPK